MKAIAAGVKWGAEGGDFKEAPRQKYKGSESEGQEWVQDDSQAFKLGC